MNLSLDHEDITAAIEAYVMKQGIQVTGKTMVTTITCGRGPNGTSATVELVKADTIAAGPEQNTEVPPRGKTSKTSNMANFLDEADSKENLEDPSIPTSDTDAEIIESTGGLFDE